MRIFMLKLYSPVIVLLGATLPIGIASTASAADESPLIARLTPQPQQLTLQEGQFAIKRSVLAIALPRGPEHEACRDVLTRALEQSGAILRSETIEGNMFRVGAAEAPPELPAQIRSDEAYSIRVTPHGAAARGASPAALLHAAQALRQLLRIASSSGQLPCLTIVDYPEFRVRGIYVEGGQERYGRIVAKDYLLEQIRRLSEFRMNTLVVECYNLFPFASFPACADEGTLSPADCREIIAEAKRFHITIVPSLQTLAQASELVWGCDAGKPYREVTAPGLMCPSNPAIYPLIQGMYRDLLTWLDDAPIIGVGCSEIDMQWQGRYCPACKRRVDAGETVRDLLLGHAVNCITAVHKASAEVGRKVRPLIWGDEFYMYGPGKDWVGIDKISKDTVMGYWKYWADYAGIDGLLRRGYDVLGISAMYNHSFYFADLSPQDPPKKWAPPMEQTGTRNITGMLAEAHKQQPSRGASFWGVATASFSKHRLRAFDSIWYGFALNGHAGWSHADRPLDDYQPDFTRAFTRHYYDARTQAAADVLADAYTRLDRCKSQLELANQTLGDVIGVYDTQEPGYQGNTLMGAFRRCATLITPEGQPNPALAKIRAAAISITKEASDLAVRLDQEKSNVGRAPELADLVTAAEKISLHAERERLMIDVQAALTQSEGKSSELVRAAMAPLAAQWSAHCGRTAPLAKAAADLSSRGDPLGFAALQTDLNAIEAHLMTLSRSGGPIIDSAQREDLLTEPFQKLDPSRWDILGQPRIVEGHLETRAPGGWSNYCGIVTHEPLILDDKRPIVVELELTPLVLGVDSQLIASTNGGAEISYRFAFSGSTSQFHVHTQSGKKLADKWANSEPGWKQRSFSATATINTTYQIRAEIRRSTWRVILSERGQKSLQPPSWDTDEVPMDDLPQTRLVFADVEPEKSTAATRWGPIHIWRKNAP